MRNARKDERHRRRHEKANDAVRTGRVCVDSATPGDRARSRRSASARTIGDERRVQLSRILSRAVSCRIHCEDGTCRRGGGESQGWLEFIAAAKLIASPEVERLLSEAT